MKHIIFITLLAFCGKVAAQPITGPLTVCAGAVTTLSNDATGGTWASAPATVAIVNSSTGDVAGVGAGTATITYFYPGGGTTTIVVTVNPLPASISGPGSVCESALINFTDISAGGTWSSSDEATAVVDAASGELSGLAAGTMTVIYMLPTGCTRSVPVTVNPLPFPITGPANICSGMTDTFYNWGGGTWSSTGAAGIINIDAASGAVTGVGAGTAIVTYTLPTSCAISTIINANMTPLADTITGHDAVCIANTANFSDASCCGLWSSSDATLATVGSGSGVVTGLSAGIVTIYYTITNSCGSSVAAAALNVLSNDDCAALATNEVRKIATELRLSPNPAVRGNFTITLGSDKDEDVYVSITNITGQKVKVFNTTTNKANSIKLDEPAGIYIISASTAGGRYEAKVTVE